MTEGSYPDYRQWLMKPGRLAGFAPKILQDVTLERTMIQTVAAEARRGFGAPTAHPSALLQIVNLDQRYPNAAILAGNNGGELSRWRESRKDA